MRLLMLSLIVFFVHAHVFAAQKIQSLITVKPTTNQQYLVIAEMGLDIIHFKDNQFTIVASEENLLRLAAEGVPYQKDIEDMTAHYQNRFDAEETMGGFMTFSEIVAYVDSLAGEYPSIMTAKFSIGKTIENRDQWAVKVSDNPGLDEAEPEVLYISLIHAREPTGAASLLHFMNHLLLNYGSDPEITDLIDNRELYFIPVLNPDGYVYNETIEPLGGGMWRKNRRDNGDGEFGVDLNRNYSFKWGYDDEGSSPYTTSTTYRGTGPFSEPETDNLRNFIIGREFVIIHNFHSYGGAELWPWGYDEIYTHKEDFYQMLGDSMTQYNGYYTAVSWRLYKTNGVADDWAWGDTISKPRIVSLTCEIGLDYDGFWPDPSQIPDLVADNVWPNLYLAKIADNPYKLESPLPPTLIDQDSVSNDYTIGWQHVDSSNPAIAYKLYEHTQLNSVIDDAESDNGYWQADLMALTSSRSHSGIKSWASTNQNRSKHLLTSTTHYKVKPDDSLKFWIWYDIEVGWNYFYVQISTDGGQTYINLEGDSTTNVDPIGQNKGNGITGASNSWTELAFDLSDWSGSQVIFRLYYNVYFFATGEGVYIDDFNKVEYFSSTNELNIPLPVTTYDFVNPDGIYYYDVVAIDQELQESVKSDYITVNVQFIPPCCQANRGNANNDPDDKANVADISYLVSWLFGTPSGPEPDCLLEANANGDAEEKVNVSDVSYLVAWLFGIPSGPEPPACP